MNRRESDGMVVFRGEAALAEEARAHLEAEHGIGARLLPDGGDGGRRAVEVMRFNGKRATIALEVFLERRAAPARGVVAALPSPA